VRIAFFDYVCDPAKPGTTGLSDIVWDIAVRLVELGDEVDIVAPYTVDQMPSTSVRVHRFPIPPIGYRNIVGHLLIILTGSRYLRHLGPIDIIHVPEYVSAAVFGLVNRDIPVVFTEPGNIYERIANGNGYDAITTQVYKLAARRAAVSCARMVATSEEMAAWWRKTGVTRDRMKRLPVGIDTSLFRRRPNAKAELNLRVEDPIVLFVARLSRENGLDIAMQAVARLRQHGVPLEFHVVGDGPERRAMMRLGEELGIGEITRWHGWVDLRELPTFYSAADVFVFSGSSGGTPRVLLQAMACGAAVVGSTIGGIVDHIKDDETGLLFPPHGVAELTERVHRLISQPDLARKLGGNAAEYAQSTVEWDVLVPILRRDVYRPLVEARGDLALAP
jgi:glycosyltransferase involved in cell wall biosynthesis